MTIGLSCICHPPLCLEPERLTPWANRFRGYFPEQVRATSSGIHVVLEPERFRAGIAPSAAVFETALSHVDFDLSLVY